MDVVFPLTLINFPLNTSTATISFLLSTLTVLWVRLGLNEHQERCLIREREDYLQGAVFLQEDDSRQEQMKSILRCVSMCVRGRSEQVLWAEWPVSISHNLF